ncbi:hypothetical protein NA57DRAFT_82011 [Rhizodiscina lignyota]|uniref:Aminoglycoside phosphotransferase domain-containing protein n=1 Tax=Rhizodiscina lignyota TaxID=1504668 RepID=A0A9P4I394_9PEZI|nr:hypothetical protein NA57DRAFT_82011 [Rhizodiscina lignyota]
MGTKSWAQQAVEEFFQHRNSPSQADCDQRAQSITGASLVRPVDAPGAFSYTVICTSCRGGRNFIVSFREPEAHLDVAMVELAKNIHGNLVPETTDVGAVKDADPPLGIYVMQYLPGIPCLNGISGSVDMDVNEETRHCSFIKSLARYFARCWSKPQRVDYEIRATQKTAISRRLAALTSSSSALPSSAISELESRLPALFDEEYPQVLTHGDLSLTNVLVDKDTHEITGLVDWSLATVLPFGMELDFLLLTLGFMNLSGWHDYICRERIQAVFWDEFWTSTGIRDYTQQTGIRSRAESAAKIGTMLRYAFKRNADGSASETVQLSGSMVACLPIWLLR